MLLPDLEMCSTESVFEEELSEDFIAPISPSTSASQLLTLGPTQENSNHSFSQLAEFACI